MEGYFQFKRKPLNYAALNSGHTIGRNGLTQVYRKFLVNKNSGNKHKKNYPVPLDLFFQGVSCYFNSPFLVFSYS